MNLLHFVKQETLVNLPKKPNFKPMDGWMDGLMDRKRARWTDGWIEKHTLIVLAHDLTLMCMGEGANWPPMYLLLMISKLLSDF